MEYDNWCVFLCCLFFFNDTATTEIYTLSLHDALPIYGQCTVTSPPDGYVCVGVVLTPTQDRKSTRLNSSPWPYLVCRLLLEKKKTIARTAASNLHDSSFVHLALRTTSR